MSRVLSSTPRAVRARELRWSRIAHQAEAEMNAEVSAHMTRGLTFDEAWLAAGGQIIPLVVEDAHSAAVREILQTTGDYWARLEEDHPLLEVPPFIVEDVT